MAGESEASAPKEVRVDDLPAQVLARLEQSGESVQAYRAYQEAAAHARDVQSRSLSCAVLARVGAPKGREEDARRLFEEWVRPSLEGREVDEARLAGVLEALGSFYEQVSEASRRSAGWYQAGAENGEGFGVMAINTARRSRMLEDLDPAIESSVAEAEGRLELLLGPPPAGGWLRELHQGKRPPR